MIYHRMIHHTSLSVGVKVANVANSLCCTHGEMFEVNFASKYTSICFSHYFVTVLAKYASPLNSLSDPRTPQPIYALAVPISILAKY